MKVIFIADLHLDSAFIGEDRTVRNTELVNNFKSVVDYAKNGGITAILIGGDLFDTPTPLTSVAKSVKTIIEQNRDIMFYAVCGNHDPLNTTAFYKSVPDNMYVFGGDISRVDLDGTALYGASVVMQSDRRNIFDGFKAEGDAIFMCHGDIASDCGFDLVRADVESSGISLLLMGHIHKTKEQLLSGPRVLHAGALHGRGFDECGQKGFYIVDTATKQYEFVPLKAKVYSEYTVNVSGCNDIADIAQKINQNTPADNEIARVVLTGGISGEVYIDTDELLKYCNNFFEIKDKTELFEDILKNADANTLEGEFIRLMLAKINNADDSQKQMLNDALKQGVIALRCQK